MIAALALRPQTEAIAGDPFGRDRQRTT